MAAASPSRTYRRRLPQMMPRYNLPKARYPLTTLNAPFSTCCKMSFFPSDWWIPSAMFVLVDGGSINIGMKTVKPRARIYDSPACDSDTQVEVACVIPTTTFTPETISPAWELRKTFLIVTVDMILSRSHTRIIHVTHIMPNAIFSFTRMWHIWIGRKYSITGCQTPLS